MLMSTKKDALEITHTATGAEGGWKPVVQLSL